MSRGWFRISGLGLLASLGVATALLAEAGSPEGRFRLVEQLYAGGQANLVENEPPLTLEIVRNGVALDATLRAGESGARHAWPAFVTDAGPLPVELIEQVASGAECGLKARYRVRPSDDLTLEIVEDYRCAEGGKALAGTYTVSFLARDSEGALSPRGSYTLHRRFERQP